MPLDRREVIRVRLYKRESTHLVLRGYWVHGDFYNALVAARVRDWADKWEKALEADEVRAGYSFNGTTT